MCNVSLLVLRYLVVLSSLPNKVGKILVLLESSHPDKEKRQVQYA
jgi:hypothetical protein